MSKSKQSTQKTTEADEKLLSQLSFYGAYHNNPYNQLIHIIFVPIIQWGLIMALNYFGILIKNDFLESINLDLTLGTFVIFAYQLYYLYLGEYLVAGTYDLFLLGLLMHANSTYKTAGPQTAGVYFLLSQIIGWGLQVIVGHQIIEQRKPALLDSLIDSIVMAPLFTWWEVLFFFGYRKDFKAKLDKQIAVNINTLNTGTALRKVH